MIVLRNYNISAENDKSLIQREYTKADIFPIKVGDEITAWSLQGDLTIGLYVIAGVV